MHLLVSEQYKDSIMHVATIKLQNQFEKIMHEHFRIPKPICSVVLSSNQTESMLSKNDDKTINVVAHVQTL